MKPLTIIGLFFIFYHNTASAQDSIQCNQVRQMYIEAVNTQNITAQRTLQPMLSRCVNQINTASGAPQLHAANYNMVMQTINSIHAHEKGCRELVGRLASTDDEALFTQLHNQWQANCTKK